MGVYVGGGGGLLCKINYVPVSVFQSISSFLDKIISNKDSDFKKNLYTRDLRSQSSKTVAHDQ